MLLNTEVVIKFLIRFPIKFPERKSTWYEGKEGGLASVSALNFAVKTNYVLLSLFPIGSSVHQTTPCEFVSRESPDTQPVVAMPRRYV